MLRKKIKVLYISGDGRSGSTILSNILGQLNGFFNAGEFHNVWTRGLIENKMCGCGTDFLDCEVWAKILFDAFGDPRSVNAEKMNALRIFSARKYNSLAKLVPGEKKRFFSHLQSYLENLEQFYSSIHNISQCKVIVDSSKSYTYGEILNAIPGIDFYVIHLVRDPRAVSYSWMRKKFQHDKNKSFQMPQRNIITSSLRWLEKNVAIELHWKKEYGKYLFIRYEDFIQDPVKHIQNILHFLRVQDQNLSFLHKERIQLKPNHSVWGNPGRFQNKDIKLQLDEEWKQKMKKRDKIVNMVITWPLMLRYKYSLLTNKLEQRKN